MVTNDTKEVGSNIIRRLIYYLIINFLLTDDSSDAAHSNALEADDNKVVPAFLATDT